MILVSVGAAVACRGGDSLLAPSQRPIAAEQAVAGLDPVIDASDSYAVADMTLESTATTTSDQPLLDPSTGQTTQTLTIDVPPEEVQFQTGFDASGQVVATTYYTAESDGADSNDVLMARLVGTTVTDYNALGQPVYDTPDEAATGADPLTQLTQVTGTALIDAIVPPSTQPPDEGEVTCGMSVGTKCQLSADVAVGSHGKRPIATRVERRSANEVRIINEIGDLRTPVMAPASSTRLRASVSAQPTRTSVAASGTNRGRVSRSYRRGDDGKWVLTELTSERDLDDGSVHLHHSQTFRVKRVRHLRNQAKDDAREQRRREEAGEPTNDGNMAEVPAPTVRLAVGPAASRARRPRLLGGGAPPPRADVVPSAPSCKSSDPNAQEVVAGPDLGSDPTQLAATPAGLVLQHGFLSGPCTWQRMAPWLKNRYQSGARVRIQTNSVAYYDDQADQLFNTMTHVVGGWNFIMIGHSNGGIVSRRVGQRVSPQAYPRYSVPYPSGFLQGIITIGSPHQGAPAMAYGLYVARQTMGSLAAPLRYLCDLGMRGCGEYHMGVDATAPLSLLDEFQRAAPVSSQMTPANAFRTDLNTANEPYTKVGIVSHAPRTWLLARMVGDSRCWPDLVCPNGAAGGREQVHRTARFYKHLVKSAIIHGLLGIANVVYGNWYKVVKDFGIAIVDGSVAAFMKAMDHFYRRVVASDDDSDGIVPGTSQIYPGATRLFPIFGADSHVGSTASTMVRDRIFLAFDAPLLFPKPPRRL